MDRLSDMLSCYVPYGCGAIVALVAYFVSGGGSWARLAFTVVIGAAGALGMALLASALGDPAPAILGTCSPLILGACILGALAAVGLFYEARRISGTGHVFPH